MIRLDAIIIDFIDLLLQSIEESQTIHETPTDGKIPLDGNESNRSKSRTFKGQYKGGRIPQEFSERLKNLLLLASVQLLLYGHDVFYDACRDNRISSVH